MFRKWRKRWRRKRAISQLAPRLEEIRTELSTVLGCAVTLVEHGSSGRDSIFLANSSDATLAAVRVNNPYLKRTSLADNMPFCVLSAAARIDREWECYSLASAADLSPRPLWRATDAIACGFVSGERLFDQLLKQPGSFWRLNTDAARALGELHHLDIVHMDASLANLVVHEQHYRFIDFEYGPSVNLTKADMRVYDHLRLVESGIKFAPEETLPSCDAWLDVVAECAAEDFASCNWSRLAPALRRVEGSALVWAKLIARFPNLAR